MLNPSPAPRHADLTLNAPSVCLAPMAGITDQPMRRLVARFGADRVTSEMVASGEIMTANREMRAKADLGDQVQGTAVQLAGRDVHWMAEAARLVADLGAQAIDINMGCPAKRVTGGLSGAALMKDPALAGAMIEAVVQAVALPVSVKMRLGWDEGQMNAVAIARIAEDAGAVLLSVHGRTRAQFYTGEANWAAIAPVVDAVNIPVLANGDIVDLASARQALAQSRAAGVLIGRAAQGQPWVVAEIRAGLRGLPQIAVPEGAALVALIAEHYELILRFYGRDLGLRLARKHLGWYLDRLSPAPDLRHALVRSETVEDTLKLIGEIAALSRLKTPVMIEPSDDERCAA